MYRHLYRNPTILSKILIKEYTNLKSEELAFRYAALAKLRTQELEFEALHQLDPIEHWDISKISLLPQIFTLLANLHRATRSDSLIQYPQIEAVNRITALLDPNMFPVQDLSLKLHTSDTMTIWEKSKTQRVTKNLGFKLNLRESTIDHSDAGEGVFLETLPANKRLVPAGTLLGFVPGLIYDNYKSYGEKTPPDMHFFRFDGPIFDFTSKIFYPYVPGFGYDEYEQKIQEIDDLAARSNRPYRNKSKGGYELVKGEDINPYALGHKINHTPRNKSTNVCLIDIFVPKNFFPEELMKFWPTQYFSTTQDFLQSKSILDNHYKNHIRGLGFISVTDIKDGEELYLDYLESCLFNMEIESPDWLIKPPPLHPQICKCNLRQESLLMMLLEDYAFQQTKDGKNFDKFYKSVLRENHQYL
ncbi:unnamed protein product [Paramecium primaurelia]|uniref:SET domain-containing protein n=1 Tax=Paramecium primaurelia TaxID=5886 RepID=A0A8S1Q8X7_PARPR|nr:unnamed protein product [Paramecium primaurelia]